MLQHESPLPASTLSVDHVSLEQALTQVSLLDDRDYLSPHSQLNASPASLSNVSADNIDFFDDLDPSDSEFQKILDDTANGTLMSFPSQSQETQPLESQKERETRSTTLTLKEQEKVIDSLKKENFGLKLKIWFLERRLEEVSPDHIDNALKENVNLKVNIQTLTQELKKYKKVILDLHSAMDILQNQKCTLPHGMTEEEHLQYDTMKMANQKYRSENDRLHQMVANISAENAKLRSSIRSQHPSRTTSPFSDFHDDSDPWTNKTSLRSSQVDLLRKEYYEAKQTIEEQNRTIRSLREEMMQRHSRSIEYGSNDHEIVKSILSDRDALVSKSEQLQKSNNDLQENMAALKERSADTMSQLWQKNRDIEKLRNNMDDLLQSLRESKKLVRIKTEECESLQQQLATQNQSPESEGLLDMLDQLRIENESLYMDAERADVLAQELAEFENLHQKEIARLEAEIEQREQECLVLEDEVDKVVAHAEELERQNQERNEQIRRLERKLRSASRLSHRSDDSNTELHRLEVEIQMRDEKIQQYEEQLDASAQLHKELERKNAQIIKYERQLQEAVHASEMHQNNLASLEEQFAEMEAALVQKDERIRDCENRVCEALEDAENAKHRYEEDLQTLEAEFQEVEQIIRERDVRIASLEDHLEAQTDAMQREKDIYEEDMRELENKYRMAAELIQEKDNLLADMEGRSATDGAYLKLKERVHELYSEVEEGRIRIDELQQLLRNAEEKLKRTRRSSNEKMHELKQARRTLEEQLENAQNRIRLMSELLDQHRRMSDDKQGPKADKTAKVLHQLNHELERELEEISRGADHDRARVQELQKLYEEAVRDKKELQMQLIRRDQMITHALEKLENTNERKEMMENVLYRQATEDVEGIFRNRSDSGMSSR